MCFGKYQSNVIVSTPDLVQNCVIC